MLGSGLRVVLKPLCLFLSDEGFRVRSMTRTFDWDTVNVVGPVFDCGLVCLIVGWYGRWRARS